MWHKRLEQLIGWSRTRKLRATAHCSYQQTVSRAGTLATLASEPRSAKCVEALVMQELEMSCSRAASTCNQHFLKCEMHLKPYPKVQAKNKRSQRSLSEPGHGWPAQHCLGPRHHKALRKQTGPMLLAVSIVATQMCCNKKTKKCRVGTPSLSQARRSVLFIDTQRQARATQLFGAQD